MPMPESTSHPKCWSGGRREHVCQKPSGRTCIESGCDNAAGTLWGPYWCPEHDVARLDHISENLETLTDARTGVSAESPETAARTTGDAEEATDGN